nr:MAG TPA: hypothetical protein [Caudoviricetes sp.]
MALHSYEFGNLSVIYRVSLNSLNSKSSYSAEH